MHSVYAALISATINFSKRGATSALLNGLDPLIKQLVGVLLCRDTCNRLGQNDRLCCEPFRAGAINNLAGAGQRHGNGLVRRMSLEDTWRVSPPEGTNRALKGHDTVTKA